MLRQIKSTLLQFNKKDIDKSATEQFLHENQFIFVLSHLDEHDYFSLCSVLFLNETGQSGYAFNKSIINHTFIPANKTNS